LHLDRNELLRLKLLISRISEINFGNLLRALCVKPKCRFFDLYSEQYILGRNVIARNAKIDATDVISKLQF